MLWIKDDVIYQGGGVVIDNMRYFNPSPEQFREAGYTEYIPPTPEPPDTTEFDNACAQFRQICGQIEIATELPGFKGGFDEMTEFQQSPVFSTLAGVQLALAWDAADKLCTYLASKLGIGQPEWWYRCWGIDPNAVETPEEESESEPSAEAEPEQTPAEDNGEENTAD